MISNSLDVVRVLWLIASPVVFTILVLKIVSLTTYFLEVCSALSGNLGFSFKSSRIDLKKDTDEIKTDIKNISVKVTDIIEKYAEVGSEFTEELKAIQSSLLEISKQVEVMSGNIREFIDNFSDLIPDEISLPKIPLIGRIKIPLGFIKDLFKDLIGSLIDLDLKQNIEAIKSAVNDIKARVKDLEASLNKLKGETKIFISDLKTIICCLNKTIESLKIKSETFFKKIKDYIIEWKKTLNPIPEKYKYMKYMALFLVAGTYTSWIIGNLYEILIIIKNFNSYA